MLLTVNAVEVSVTIEGEKTLGEVFQFLEDDFEKNGSTIVGVSVNGKQISPDAFDVLFSTEIETVSEVDVQTACAADIFDMLRVLAQQCTPLETALSEVSVHLQTNNDEPVMKTITEFADLMSLFYRIMPLVHLFEADFEQTRMGDISIIQFAEELKPVLQEFLNAFKQKDTVLLGDIAEYEIAPRLHTFILTFA